MQAADVVITMGCGDACSRSRVLETDGSPVMTLIALNMIRRRPDAAG